MAKNGYINIVSRYIGKKCIAGMLGAPDCTQSPNIAGNLGIIAGMHSVMDCMPSISIGKTIGIIVGML